MKSFLHFLMLGPSIDFAGKKRFKIDLLPLVGLLFAILSVVLQGVLRGFDLGMQDIRLFFPLFLFSFNFGFVPYTVFFVVFFLLLGAIVYLSVRAGKKKYTFLYEGVALVLALVSIFYVIYSAFRVPVNASNFGLWIIMMIPQILLSIALLAMGYRLIHKAFFGTKEETEEKRVYFEAHVALLSGVGLAIWNVLKAVLFFFRDFFVRVGKGLASFGKKIVASCGGEQLGNFSPKTCKDPLRIAIAVSGILSACLYFLFRGAGAVGEDIASFFAQTFTFEDPVHIVFFALILLGLGGVVALCLIAHRKRYYSLEDGVCVFAFVMGILYVIHYSLRYGVKANNWLLYLVILLPQIVFLCALLPHAVRLFTKVIAGKRTPEREEDYRRRLAHSRKGVYRAGVFMKKNWGQVLVVISLICLALAVLYPISILLLRSFKFSKDDLVDPFGIPGRFTFDNYTYMWKYLQTAYMNSLLTTIGVTAGTMILASCLAFAFIRFHFPWKNILFYCIIGLMMIPGILTLISRFQLVNDMGLVGSLWGIVLPGIAGYIPMAFMLLFTFFKGIPKDLFEAADMDGATDLKTFMHVVVPLSKPILSTIAIQTFVGEWNDYLWAYLIVGSDESKQTLPVLLQSLSSSYESQSLAMAAPFAGYVLSAIPLVLIFIVASKQFIEGLTSGAFKM